MVLVEEGKVRDDAVIHWRANRVGGKGRQRRIGWTGTACSEGMERKVHLRYAQPVERLPKYTQDERYRGRLLELLGGVRRCGRNRGGGSRYWAQAQAASPADGKLKQARH